MQCCVAPHMQGRMTIKQRGPEGSRSRRKKIVQDMKPHGESVWVLDIEQGNLTFQTKFQIRPCGNPVRPIMRLPIQERQ